MMTGTTLRDRWPIERLRGATRTDSVWLEGKLRKRNWVKKIARMNSDEWPRRITDWRPWKFKRGRGRPRTRWRDDFVKNYGAAWARIAINNPEAFYP